MIMYSASSTGGQSRAVSPTTTTRQQKEQWTAGVTGSVAALQLGQQLRDGFLLSLSDVAKVLRVQNGQEGLQVPDQLGQHCKETESKDKQFVFHQLCLLQSVPWHLKALSGSSMNRTGLH